MTALSGGGGLVCPDWLIFLCQNIKFWNFRQHHNIHLLGGLSMEQKKWKRKSEFRMSYWRGAWLGRRLSFGCEYCEFISCLLSPPLNRVGGGSVGRSVVGRTTKGTRYFCHPDPSLHSFSYWPARLSPTHSSSWFCFYYGCRSSGCLISLTRGILLQVGWWRRQEKIEYILLLSEGTWLIACPGIAI